LFGHGAPGRSKKGLIIVGGKPPAQSCSVGVGNGRVFVTSKPPQIMSNRVMENDARLTNLEIKLSFTEDMLDELNKTLFRQQQQIDLLVREVNTLRRQDAGHAATSARSAADELPPHY
jgi:SlyX protein